MENEEKIRLIELALKKINGVNVILKDNENKILVGRSTYGEQKYMLPGGAIERGELPKHAAISEVEEETGFVIEEKDLTLAGYFTQRLPGVQSAQGTLFLFECTNWEKQELVSIKPELVDIEFMSFQDIVNKKELFGLGYLRMIISYFRLNQGLEERPFEKRLSDATEITYTDYFLRV